MIDNRVTVAELLLDELDKMGVEYIFMVPGAHIAPLYAKLCEKKRPKFIIADHELEAAFMAIGYARASNKLGVVFTIGAPGAAYMVGAGITAKADNVPVLFVTGDIPEKHHGLDEFQDASKQGTNDSAIFQAAVGRSVICRTLHDIIPIISQIHQYKSECKPLHIQIPIDVQLSELTLNFQCEKIVRSKKHDIPLTRLNHDHKIVFLFGIKALDSIDSIKLKDFVKAHAIGVVTDLKTRGIFSEDSLESIGYIGFSSNPRALEVFNLSSRLKADHIISVGVKSELIKKYIDPSFLMTDISVAVFDEWLISIFSKDIEKTSLKKRQEWLTSLKELVHTEEAHSSKNKVSYLEMFDVLNKIMPKETIYAIDAGQVRRAANMFITCYYPRSFIQSDTLSPMGSAICAGVGAKLASPEKPVVVMLGDGSMRMHGMVLATAARYNISVIFILSDNHSYANILKSNELRDVSDLPKLDWGMYAQSLGVASFFIDSQKEFEKRLEEIIPLKKPALLWVAAHRSVDFEYNQTKVYEYKDWLTDIKEKFYI